MSLPKINIAFDGWEQEIELIKTTQSIVDYQTTNTEEIIIFRGVVQPLTAEKLNQKPIETRSWQWLQIHVRDDSEIDLTTNDLIGYESKKFKVMAKLDYKLYGYNEYHCVKNYG